MYIQVPPSVVLIDLETGKPLSDENVTDDRGRTLKSLGIPYENKPFSMRKWWLRYLAPLYKGYEEMKSGRRVEKALKHAEEIRNENGSLPVEEISKDDVKILREKVKALTLGADVLFQFETFLDAVDKASDEKFRW